MEFAWVAQNGRIWGRCWPWRCLVNRVGFHTSQNPTYISTKFDGMSCIMHMSTCISVCRNHVWMHCGVFSHRSYIENVSNMVRSFQPSNLRAYLHLSERSVPASIWFLSDPGPYRMPGCIATSNGIEFETNPMGLGPGVWIRELQKTVWIAWFAFEVFWDSHHMWKLYPTWCDVWRTLWGNIPVGFWRMVRKQMIQHIVFSKCWHFCV